jgi:Leucine-rich repeat (LRR) protein
MFAYLCGKFIRLDPTADLSTVRHLRLNYFENINILTENIGKLGSLHTLDIFECEQVEEILDCIGKLTSLQSMLIQCKLLRTLPDGIGEITSLQTLCINKCRMITTLPENISNLTSLRILQIEHCQHLMSLPETIGDLGSLQKIKIDGCIALQALPESFGNLRSLEELELIYCALVTLPETIGDLSFLQKITIDDCLYLQALPKSFGNLRSLQKMHIEDCPALKTLPESFGNLTSLWYMKYRNCKNLQELPETISSLTSLSVLNISRCDSLKKLPETIGNLTSLKELLIESSYSLETIPETISTITSLKKLTLDYGRSFNTNTCHFEENFLLDLSVIHTAIAAALRGLNLTKLVISSIDCDIIRIMHGMDKLQEIVVYHSKEDITREHLLLISKLYKQDIKKLKSLSFGRLALNTISEPLNLALSNNDILNHFRSEQRITRKKLVICALDMKNTRENPSLFSQIDDLVFRMICEMVTEKATIKGIPRCEKCQKQIRDHGF